MNTFITFHISLSLILFLFYFKCSVYYIRSDMASDPYGAVHVVWMQQEKNSDQWLYQYEQTDSRKFTHSLSTAHGL